VLEGQTWIVSCALALPRGVVVSASWDGTLRVWDGDASGGATRVLTGHADAVRALAALESDGDDEAGADDTVVSGAADGALRVWRVSTGACLASVPDAHAAAVTCLLALPRGRVVSAAADGSLAVWHARTGARLCSLKGHSGEVVALARLPDGCGLQERVASASKDKPRASGIWPTSSRAARSRPTRTPRAAAVAARPRDLQARATRAAASPAPASRARSSTRTCRTCAPSAARAARRTSRSARASATCTSSKSCPPLTPDDQHNGRWAAAPAVRRRCPKAQRERAAWRVCM
jgi:WD40 repeat protein